MSNSSNADQAQAYVVVDPPAEFNAKQTVFRPVVVELTPVRLPQSLSQEDFLADATLCSENGKPVADDRGRTLEPARLGARTGYHDGVASVFFIFSELWVELAGRFVIRFEVRYRGGLASDYAYTRAFNVRGQENPELESAHWAGLSSLEYNTIQALRRRLPDAELQEPPIRRPAS